jgi:hypothetical protein
MRKISNIWIDGWCICARLFYFSFISSILLIPVQAIPIIISCFIKIDDKTKLVINGVCLLLFIPFVCYWTSKITKLLGKQISFPLLCPKCGSFVERKDAKIE